MLIKAYGFHWNPEWIYGFNGQSAKNSFKGHVKRGKRTFLIDFWNARGVYALFKNYEIVYVGKVTNMSLGTRISMHYRYLRDHWDTFSFYCYSDINYKAEKVYTSKSKLAINKDDSIKTLEALIINTSEPFLNKQEARFPNSRKAKQKQFLEPITIDDVMEKLEYLEKKLVIKKRKN